ncbi:MAG: glycosyltransferase [Wenzhouxiangellaceae bacterium]|nr:glycosyltransferase [Wenzhouxiangellaceae bacterium]
MSKPQILILSEQPPLNDSEPATGLTVRHTLMAQALAGQGLRVSYAWPAPGAGRDAPDADGQAFECLALASTQTLADWLKRNNPDAIVLGYWELADWLPARLDAALLLDYIAPRLLERQFEDREQLDADIRRLVPLLARCDEVWVGNRRQRDLMLPWMMLAGHDCRFELPIEIVPIAGRVDQQARPARDPEAPLVLFHGGRDWPWRDSSAWLDALRDASGPWRLDDTSQAAGLVGHAEYLRRLASADLAIELSDDNTERRFSQSFRTSDALCRGVPVVCNAFLPLAETIERSGAGWILERPEQLPALLQSLHADRAELERRAGNARMLAHAELDADRVYASLAGRISKKTGSRAKRSPRQPLSPFAEQRKGQFMRVMKFYTGRWIHYRLRLPFHSLLRRLAVNRPLPERDNACWVVVSRPDLFPTDHGAAVKIERTAWGLSFHVDQVLLLTDRRRGYWRYRRGSRDFVPFPVLMRLPGWPLAVNLIRLMMRGLPYSNAFLYVPLVDRGLHARLVWLLNHYPVEAVQGEFPAYAHPAVWAARLFGTKSIMVEHNVEHRRLAEQLPELGEAARQWLEHKEIDLANACDHVITVSEPDRQELIAGGVQPARIVTIPHGVDLERANQATAVDLRKKYDIASDHAILVYHGIYIYPPNLEAVEELANSLLPELKQRGHHATVVAIGPEPPDRSLPGVVFTGSVDDLAGHLKGADLAVIPLRQGGGTRMKILDDFAVGVPVIATSKGAEGIPVEHGEHLLIIDDPDQMAEAVIALLENDHERSRLAANARDWVGQFDWREIARRYVETVRGQS